MPEGLILASASPRRVELLRQLGVVFTVQPSGVDETLRPGEDGVAFACRAARDKADAVAVDNPDAWVLGADTVVLVGSQVLGKPRDEEDARRMLRMLSGRRHRVVTAVVLLGPRSGGREEIVIESGVEFRALDEPEIDAYIATAEPYDKAGAYAVQGAARSFIRGVDGSYTNVIGLPLDEVRDLLSRHRLLPATADPRSSA